MSSIWYKPKSKDDPNPHLYTYDEWTLLTKIVFASFIFACILFVLIISGIVLSAASHARSKAAAATTTTTAPATTANVAPQPLPKPNLFIRLGDVEGMDPCASSPASPALQLIVDADWMPPRYRYCSGGGNSMLRVSYHGITLAWGHVPWFCVERGQSEEDGVDAVVTVEARADGAVLREEVRSSIQTDLDGEGKAQFAVEGEVTGLGYLSCETSLFQGDATEESCPCRVQ